MARYRIQRAGRWAIIEADSAETAPCIGRTVLPLTKRQDMRFGADFNEQVVVLEEGDS